MYLAEETHYFKSGIGIFCWVGLKGEVTSAGRVKVHMQPNTRRYFFNFGKMSLNNFIICLI